MKVIIEADQIPKYKTDLAAAVDLHAAHDATIRPWKHVLIDTSTRIQMPDDVCAEVMSRSGLALQRGIQAHHGLIDPDYRKSIGVILFNFGSEEFEVKKGDRIAQLKFSKFERAEFVSQQVEDNDRGGFGHTGV